jgi:hypothetical protein
MLKIQKYRGVNLKPKFDFTDLKQIESKNDDGTVIRRSKGENEIILEPN